MATFSIKDCKRYLIRLPIARVDHCQSHNGWMDKSGDQGCLKRDQQILAVFLYNNKRMVNSPDLYHRAAPIGTSRLHRAIL